MTEEELKNETQKSLLTINKTIQELIDSIKNDIPNAQDKLKKFVNAFEDEFPLENTHNRGSAEALTWALMGGPLVLYALGKNGSAIIELHGILEAFSAREIDGLFPTPIRETIKSRVIRRCTLEDLALILRDLGIWDEEDVKFVEKLKKLRNGVAHKNPKLVSNTVYSGKEISMLDIDSIMADIDCIPLTIRTIHLLHKLAMATTPNKKT